MQELLSRVGYWILKQMPLGVRLRVYLDTLRLYEAEMGPTKRWDKGDWQAYHEFAKAMAEDLKIGNAN